MKRTQEWLEIRIVSRELVGCNKGEDDPGGHVSLEKLPVDTVYADPSFDYCHGVNESKSPTSRYQSEIQQVRH